MSLSTWFRDYLYVPLGGNRGASWRVYANLVTVFFLCGLWHGASWNFVVWGLYHGAFLVLERLGLANLLKRVWPPVRHAYLLLVVMVGWVFFRADSLHDALVFLRAMAGTRGGAPAIYTVGWFLTPELWLALAAGVLGSMPIVPSLAAWHDRARAGDRQVTTALAPLATVALTLLLAASMMQIAARTYNPFIYFRF
jgi:alginate O-acetyltransferase complex protein AlgI